MSKINRHTRFIILFAIVVAMGIALYIVWSNYSQQVQAEKEMREKAYVLSQQLDAVWEFMAINQDRINYDANGDYNFKGLHCSLVGKSISKLFGRKTDYVIRYVNHKPRNPDDVPDAFESAALNRFASDRSIGEVYKLADYAGERAFRYVVPMTIDQTCLECHGEPAGELDVLGYTKEGWHIGDLGGALSIVMPIDIYIDNKKSNMIREIAFFCLLMLALVLTIYYATVVLVTRPLLDDNQYKSEFLATMSHELRTPLTSIVAFTEVLDKTTPLADEKQKQVIHEIKNNSGILLTLINNILDMARLEAGKTEFLPEPVDLVDVINAVDGVIEPLVTKKGLSFTSTVNRNVPVISADREMLRHIVENIVSNAVKFTPEGGKIELWVDYDPEAGEIRIHVKDNGIGIGRGHLNLIFDKFVQGNSAIHRPYSGSGLGLSLARELTELHGGRIVVESKLGEGSHFTVIMPVKIL